MGGKSDSLSLGHARIRRSRRANHDRAICRSGRGRCRVTWCAMSEIDLVIFDCDGVLVDSERLVIRVEVEILARLGWPLNESDVIERFVGRSAGYMHQEVERHLGRSVNWDTEFESRYREV